MFRTDKKYGIRLEIAAIIALACLLLLGVNGVFQESNSASIIIFSGLGILAAVYLLKGIGNLLHRNASLIEALENRITEMDQRFDELDCLLRLSHLHEVENPSADSFLRRAVELLPQGFFYPENLEVRIIYRGKSHQSRHFRESGWKLQSSFETLDKEIGLLEVFYTVKRKASEIGPFTSREKEFLDTVAHKIARIIQKIESPLGSLESANSETSLPNRSFSKEYPFIDISGILQFFSDRFDGLMLVFPGEEINHEISDFLQHDSNLLLYPVADGNEALFWIEYLETKRILLVAGLFLPDMNAPVLALKMKKYGARVEFCLATDYPPNLIEENLHNSAKIILVEQRSTLIETLHLLRQKMN